MKKISPVLLALTLILLTSIAVYAEEDSPVVIATGSCGIEANWTLYDNGILDISGTGDMTDYGEDEEPWYSYNEYIKKIVIEEGITSIGKNAFEDRSFLTSVEIPDSVENIDYCAFYECIRLRYVYISGNVKTIGQYAFWNCDSCTIWCEADSAAEDWHSQVTNTAEFVYGSDRAEFEFWNGLKGRETSVTIPDGIQVIPTSAFQNNSRLKSVTIPDSVTRIGDFAFQECRNLKDINIPDSVTDIGTVAFYNCTKLTDINIPDGVTSLGASVFYNCDGLTSLVIPASVTGIGFEAFYDCDGLESLTIPGTVDTIGFESFCGCENLTSVSISDGVSLIALSAFYGCTNLTSISIPDTVTRIGDDAFRYCNLHTVFIPQAVRTIGANAFIGNEGCTFYCERAEEPETWDIDWYDNDESAAVYSSDRDVYTAKRNAFSIAASPATYTGKNLTPEVKVCDGYGAVLTMDADYTVENPASMRNVGAYKLVVKGTGVFDGASASTKFTVRPAGTTIRKLFTDKKSFTVSWKKQASQTTGYQIRYSLKSTMSSSKVVTVSKNSTTSKKISKLKARKRYYVQIRTYKTVKGKRYYSTWSAKKSVVTK